MNDSVVDHFCSYMVINLFSTQTLCSGSSPIPSFSNASLVWSVFISSAYKTNKNKTNRPRVTPFIKLYCTLHFHFD